MKSAKNIGFDDFQAFGGCSDDMEKAPQKLHQKAHTCIERMEIAPAVNPLVAPYCL
jgi:hypothetical protein